jgi:hypothetical protein
MGSFSVRSMEAVDGERTSQTQSGAVDGFVIPREFGAEKWL